MSDGVILRMAQAMFPDAFDESHPENADQALMTGRQERAMARASKGFMATLSDAEVEAIITAACDRADEVDL